MKLFQDSLPVKKYDSKVNVPVVALSSIFYVKLRKLLYIFVFKLKISLNIRLLFIAHKKFLM